MTQTSSAPANAIAPTRTSANAVSKEPCPDCGSKDNLVRYDDGSAFCFSPACGRYEKADGDPGDASAEKAAPSKVSKPLLTQGTFFSALPARSITKATCEKFGYKVGQFKGKRAQIAPYYSSGRQVAQKIRLQGKDFTVLGEGKALPFFGQNVWNSGKYITVTEGEIDALSVSQVQGNKWPVVSLPAGAASAGRTFAAQVDYLTKFEKVILMFDQDDAGEAATLAAAAELPPGKAYIATLPMKDANEMLKAGRGSEIISAIYNAEPWRPDNIVPGYTLLDELMDRTETPCVAYGFRGLDDMLLGLRDGELVTITAGSGSGKSTFCRELAYSLIRSGEPVGLLFLEESVKRTATGIMGLHLNRPLHKPDVREATTDEEMREAFAATIGQPGVYLYDSFGSSEIDHLINKLRYLVQACGCKTIFLDHISIIFSGQRSTDERKSIDLAMTSLRTLVQELQFKLIIVSHLRRSEGDRGYEEGKKTSLSGLRGSHSIGQLSDIVIALERNQQSEENANHTVARVLKNRFTGETGIGSYLEYDGATGRMRDIEYEEAGEVVGY
jgi:twinkle protein